MDFQHFPHLFLNETFSMELNLVKPINPPQHRLCLKTHSDKVYTQIMSAARLSTKKMHLAFKWIACNKLLACCHVLLFPLIHQSAIKVKHLRLIYGCNTNQVDLLLLMQWLKCFGFELWYIVNQLLPIRGHLFLDWNSSAVFFIWKRTKLTTSWHRSQKYPKYRSDDEKQSRHF